MSTPKTLALLLKDSRTLLARGAGRAYGDAGVGLEQTLDMRGLDRFIAFDEESGLLTVEAGVMLQDIITLLLPRGFFPPVVPGTQFVTVGGMIAANVHGKNHHREGGFGRHLVEMQLALHDGSLATCSRSQNEALFRATIGGMGLTGIIVAASFKLQRVETGFIRQETLIATDLDEAMRYCEDSRDWRYTVAWIDGFATGKRLGRALVYRGDHARAEDMKVGRARLEMNVPSAKSIPFFFPARTLNRHTVRLFNEIYYRKASKGSEVVHWSRYFFPLDAISGWNRIYGRRGFIQHQSVFPMAKSRNAIRSLLELISRQGNPSFLAVLKLLGEDGDGLLGFPMEGYTLAIDFPADPKSLALADELDRIVVAHGGRIYLAKDARQSRDTFESGYPNLGMFRELRRSTGAGAKFRSYLSKRLGL